MVQIAGRLSIVYYIVYMGKIINGNCLEVLDKIDPNSIDLVFTSPPYAQQRKKYYESISETDYPFWTLQWMNKLIPSLKLNASVLIIIRTNLKNGVISDYVLKTRLLLRENGWLEPEELLWIKPDGPPLGSNYRPRRSWENILWFSRTNKPYCNSQSIGEFTEKFGLGPKSTKKGLKEYVQGVSETQKTGIARCRDYFVIPVSGNDRSEYNTHPAQFPPKIAEQAILVFSPEKGCVLDPFIGSGTTAVAAIATLRDYIGIEIEKKYCEIAEKRVVAAQQGLVVPSPVVAE
jgi:DNA modification methylase